MAGYHTNPYSTVTPVRDDKYLNVINQAEKITLQIVFVLLLIYFPIHGRIRMLNLSIATEFIYKSSVSAVLCERDKF